MFNFRMMKKKEFKPIGLFLFILIIISFFLACAKEDDKGHPPKPPIEIPFEVHKAGAKVETEMQTVENQSYYIFELKFKYNENKQGDWERVIKLTGTHGRDKHGRLIEPGVPIYLRLNIQFIDSAGGQPLFEKEINDPHELRLTSWGNGYFSKQIAGVKMKPGRYRVSLESLKDVTDLVGTLVFLQITYMTNK